MLALALAGCSTTGSKDQITTGSIPKLSKPVEQMTGDEASAATVTFGKAYEANPKDRDVGVNYASALRMSGRNAQALAVMQQVAIANPNDRGVLAAYGKSQAAAGQLEEALQTIARAQTPDRPDWRLVSAEGAILDQLGRTDEARAKYRDALLIQPNEPSVLSNLGMSYVLSKDLPKAEELLRRAYAGKNADARVRQNLALVVGLQGRFSEAEGIVKADLPPEEAAANVAYLKEMLNSHKDIPRLGAAPADASSHS